jgi:hypothetical protein
VSKGNVMPRRARKPPVRPNPPAPANEAKDDVPTARPVVVAILFETPQVSLESIEPALARQTILGRRATASPSGRSGDAADSFGVELGETIVAGMVMPVPYPAAELELGIASAWTWPPSPEATVVRDAKSHVILVVTGGKGTPVENHLIATAVASLVASLPGALGVYWPSGRALHYPPLFASMASALPTQENPPLFLWCNFCIAPDPDGTISLFTVGLGALDLMEMEIHGLRESPIEIRERAARLVAHQLKRRPAFRPGDTTGDGQDAQLRVAHRLSSFGLSGTVLYFEAI